MTAALFSPLGRLCAQTTFCGNPLGTSVNNQNSSAFASSTWATGARVTVTGILTINQNLSCSGVYFQMNPGSSIKVANGYTFTASNGTNFTGCVTVWSGITVESGAAINFSQCIVQDARIGLRFMPGFNAAQSALSGNYFQNNITGIAALNFPSNAPFLLSNFSGNHFRKKPTGSLLLVPPFLPPYYPSYYPSPFPLRGIWVANGAADLAYGASVPNDMTNLRYGIVADSATVTVANCRFDGMVNDAINVSDPYDGCPIYARKSDLTVAGSGNGNCRFLNSPTADIYSRFTRALNVSGSSSTYARLYGEKVTESGVNATIDIRENTYTVDQGNFVSAIYVERPPGSTSGTSVFIDHNIITVQDLDHYKNPKVMIDVVGKFGAVDHARIERNIITVNENVDRIHGIRITGLGNNFHVENHNILNYISQDTNPTVIPNSLGIIAQDLLGTNNFVSSNEVTSELVGVNSFLRAGIHVEHNPNFLHLCENILNNTHRDLECVGKLDATELKKNLLGPAAFGLWCSGSATMPDQDRFENRWTASSYATLGAKYDISSPGFFIIRDVTNSINNDQPPSNSWSPSSWFQTQSGSNSTCGFLPASSINSKEQGFINEVTPNDTTAANWDTRRELLYKLKRFPELAAQNESVAKYLNNNSGTSPWQYAEAQMRFEDAYAIASGLNAQIGTLQAQYRVLLGKILDLDNDQASDTTSYDLAIATQRANKFAQLCVVSDSLTQRGKNVGTVQTALQAALTYAQQLPTTGKAYEANLKSLLGVMVHYAQGGDSLVVGDSTLVRGIAAQCELYGGSSIRLAPLWLAQAEGLRYIGKDWEAGCVAGPRGKETSVLPTARVIPNPVTNVAQIIFPEGIAGRWMVNDLTGRVIQQGNWDESTAQATISALNWQPGLYFLVCQPVKGPPSSTKFIVIH